MFPLTRIPCWAPNFDPQPSRPDPTIPAVIQSATHNDGEKKPLVGQGTGGRRAPLQVLGGVVEAATEGIHQGASENSREAGVWGGGWGGMDGMAWDGVGWGGVVGGFGLLKLGSYHGVPKCPLWVDFNITVGPL